MKLLDVQKYLKIQNPLSIYDKKTLNKIGLKGM